jgi:hypothetical protein
VASPSEQLLPCPFCPKSVDIVDATKHLCAWRVIHRCEFFPTLTIDRETASAAAAWWNDHIRFAARKLVDQDALKLAAYRAGVEEAARIADNYSDCEQDSVDGSHRPNDAMIVRDAIRALPDPTTDELERIK